MGGEGQPQTQATIFSRYAYQKENLQTAINNPRWLLGRTWGEETTSLKIEDRYSDEVYEKLKSIGPDFLKDGFGPDQFYNLLKKYPNKTISEFLMNQKIVSGIGNYLKAECLYDAKISPHRFCCHISTKESDRLFYACRRITQLSYQTGGATIQNYRKPNGKKGLYSQRFAVYNQKVAPCGNQVIKEKEE